MSYAQLTLIHLLTVVPAFFIATYLLLNRKGTSKHKAMGRVYMILMSVTALISLFMKAQVGPKLLNHFGFIHLLSIVTLYSVTSAYLASKKGNIKRHKNSMVTLYVGGLLLAGTLAFLPGRMLHSLVFGAH